MKHIQTKAKWSLGLDGRGYPQCGYYEGYPSTRPKTLLAPGVNVLFKETLFVIGTGRGRSASYLNVQAKNGWRATLSLTGIDGLIDDLSTGLLLIGRDTLGEGEDARAFATVTGWWTMAKRGTEHSLISAPEAIVAKHCASMLDI